MNGNVSTLLVLVVPDWPVEVYVKLSLIQKYCCVPVENDAFAVKFPSV